jgi:two-component system, OmpR family, KDP operon response regulator KdpE
MDAQLPQDISSAVAAAREQSSDRSHTSKAGKSGGERVLVIDDEIEIYHAIRPALEGATFLVEWASTASEGLQMITRWQPNVVILDLFLPDIDGLEVCRQLRRWSSVPVVVLSVRASDQDKITAFESGADDYLTKPFSIGELLARVRVAIRHAPQTTGTSGNTTRGLVLDFENRQVAVNGVEVHLTPTQYEVLKYLVQHADKVVTHRILIRAVWGTEYEEKGYYLRAFIAQLRRKLEPDPGRPRYILTEPGIGYRFRSGN